jgi:hypothetical protein
LDGQFSLESLLLEQTVNELSAGGMAQTLDCLAEGRGFDPYRLIRYPSFFQSDSKTFKGH